MNKQTEKIFIVAAIRRYVDTHFPEGVYIDVMEKVVIPSEDGDYKEFDAVVITSSKNEKEIFSQCMKDWKNVKVILI